MTMPVLIADPWDGYALIDSGGGRKLEQYGDVRLVRPEPQAMWQPSAPAEWDRADTRFESARDDGDDDGPGRWSDPVGDFTVPVGPARMICRLGNNHHPGLFPEQKPHWDNAVAALKGFEGAEVLNLFGYTGAASLILAAAGAKVTHIDASKKAIAWARENQEASGLDGAQVRWICEDAAKFVAREVRRGRTYQGILLDPPKFGRGPKNEVWNLFDDLPPLMRDVAAITAPDARFVVLTAYAIRASALAVGRLMEEVMAPRGGTVEAGELALRESASGRLLPTSMFAVWRPENAR